MSRRQSVTSSAESVTESVTEIVTLARAPLLTEGMSRCHGVTHNRDVTDGLRDSDSTGFRPTVTITSGDGDVTRRLAIRVDLDASGMSEWTVWTGGDRLDRWRGAGQMSLLHNLRREQPWS